MNDVVSHFMSLYLVDGPEALPYSVNNCAAYRSCVAIVRRNVNLRGMLLSSRSLIDSGVHVSPHITVARVFRQASLCCLIAILVRHERCRPHLGCKVIYSVSTHILRFRSTRPRVGHVSPSKGAGRRRWVGTPAKGSAPQNRALVGPSVVGMVNCMGPSPVKSPVPNLTWRGWSGTADMKTESNTTREQ